MRKILLFVIAFYLSTSIVSASYIDKNLKEVKINSQDDLVQQYISTNEKLSTKSQKINGFKDPKLIQLAEYKFIDEYSYNVKLNNDEQIYETKIRSILDKNRNSTNVESASVDFYKVYRIAERLIRANNLDFVNWRISISKSEDVKAASFDENYIQLNTALYDSLSLNEDALAFVIAHEMAHQILGHNHRNVEFMNNLENYERYIKKRSNVIYGNLAFKNLQRMELIADTEALILFMKAGYSTDRAMEAFSFLNTFSDIPNFYITSSFAKERIQNAQRNIEIADPAWVNIGKENIYNSDVIPCEKSSDGVSIILAKSNVSKYFYAPENIDLLLKRIAYMNYVHGNMREAIKYFERLNDEQESYVTYLYLSYANEYLYKQTQKEKYLKSAQKMIKKAKRLNSEDKYVIEQFNNLYK